MRSPGTTEEVLVRLAIFGIGVTRIHTISRSAYAGSRRTARQPRESVRFSSASVPPWA